jgi:hypothetical protein
MCIRVIDLIIYAAVFVGGIYAMAFTPLSITKEFAGWTWLVPFWAGFLLLGGLVGFIGRLTTIWLLEPAADFAAATGILIYVVVLGRTALDTITSTVAFVLVIVAFLNIMRRYVELQLFGSDPSHTDPKSKLVDAWKRRIPDVSNWG